VVVAQPGSRRRTAVLATVGLALASALGGQSCAAHAAGRSGNASTSDEGRSGFRQVNLVSDLSGRAQLRDPDVKNPRGIAFGPATPLWVSNNFNPASANPKSPADFRTEITVYSGANGKQKITKVPLEVAASALTGIVFNPTSAFVVSQRGVRPGSFPLQ
jgi:hypothetical protein